MGLALLIFPPVVKCNVDAVFVNELNFRLHNLKAHNEGYYMHIKLLKMRNACGNNDF